MHARVGRKAALIAWLALGGCAGATSWDELAERGDSEDLIAMIDVFEDHRAGTERLADLLDHPAGEVRRRAALALGRNEWPSGIPPLVDALGSEHHELRLEAAFALGQIGLPGPEPLLERLPVEKSPVVREELWRALGRTGGRAVMLAARQAEGPDRVPAMMAAAEAGRALGQVPDWIAERLTHEDPQVRAAALYAYVRSLKAPPQAARHAAGQALASSVDGTEREMAVRVLERGAAGVEAAVGPALAASGLSAQQQAALAAGLGRTDSEEATRALLYAAAALAGPLRRSLVDPRFHVLRQVVLGLKGRRLLPPQRDALDLLAGELTTLQAGSAPSEERRRAMLRCAFSRARKRTLGCVGVDLIEALAEQKADPALIRKEAAGKAPSVQMAALDALVRRGADVTDDVLAALKSGDSPLAATAARIAAEQKLTSGRVVVAIDEAFGQALERKDWESGQGLVTALATLDPSRGLKAAMRGVASDNLALRRASVPIVERVTNALGVLNEPSVPAFDPALVEAAVDRDLPERAVVTTDVGRFEIALRPDVAPRAVASLARLAGQGFYQGLTIHRYVPNFVVQGGDPRGDGWGGPGYSLRDENSRLPYLTGTVGVPLAGKDTGGSQLFITLSARPHLYGTYPAIGRVVSGFEVVDRLVEGDRITHIAVE